MDRNIWIGAVILLVLVVGGWWYFNQSKSSLNIKDVKVGDIVGGLTVASIETLPTRDSGEIEYEIKFTGTISVRGTVLDVMGNGPEGQMLLQKSENPNLPRFIFDQEHTQAWLGVDKALPGKNGDTYLVTLDNYVLDVTLQPKDESEPVYGGRGNVISSEAQ